MAFQPRKSMEQRRYLLSSSRVDWGDLPSAAHSAPSQNDERTKAPAPRDPQRKHPASRATHRPDQSSIGSPSSRDEDDSDAYVAPAPHDLIKMDRQVRVKKALYAPVVTTCKGWTLASLLSQGKNFREVPRAIYSSTEETEETEAQIKRHEEANPGVPLVVQGLHTHQDFQRTEFSPEYFVANGPKDISVRNVHDRTDKDISLSEFIERTRAMSPFKEPYEQERLYGKDVACPPKWANFLHTGKVIPTYLAPDTAENLLNNLPQTHRPETLMCYVGVGDTFTPCHKDLCASSGHNLMCYTENGGSSFWFLTATSSANAAAEYFQSIDQVLDHDSHVITLKELANAPFEIYITEQKLGDLVLVPPRSVHQVVNSGGITIKTSWSRMTLDGLSMALHYELPLYRRVCRPETYKVKATIYHTLLKAVVSLSDLLSQKAAKTMSADLKILGQILPLFDSIMIEEFAFDAPHMRQLAKPNDNDEEIDQLSCDFCGGDIFLSFFECTSCVNGSKRAAHGAGFIICPGCYAEGRTCACEVMLPMQCRFLDQLWHNRARAVDLFKACSELTNRKADSMRLNGQLQMDSRRIGLFQAAITLRKKRMEMTKGGRHEESRRCNFSRSEFSHPSSSLWVLPCSSCHHSSCFAHLVHKTALHSAEAFLISDQNGAVHEAHFASRDRYRENIKSLKCEELDYVPDPRVQLAYLAITFTTCRPINPNPQLWKSGHYDFSAWEISLPKVIRSMVAKPVSSRPRPASKQRQVMDCVLVDHVSLRTKRKLRPDRAISSDQRSDQIIIRDDGNASSSKDPNIAPFAKLPPKIKHTSSLDQRFPRRKIPARVDSSSSSSESEDDRPLKRLRANRPSARISRPIIRISKSAPQPAISVADAFNIASVQNSRSSNSSREPPSSVSAAVRKKTQSTPVSDLPAPSIPSAGIDNNVPNHHETFGIIMAQLSRMQQTQAVQAAALEYMLGAQAGHLPLASTSAPAIQPSTGLDSTVKSMADMVTHLVSSLIPQPPVAGSSTGVGSRFDNFAPWNRTGPRGESEAYTDHSHRPIPPRDMLPGYCAPKQRLARSNAPFPVTRHRPNIPSTRYYEERIWIQGPHARERPEQRARHESHSADERHEAQETPRRRRKFTRFSPPRSPGQGLDLVRSHSRTSRPLYGREARGEGEGEANASSDATLANSEPAGKHFFSRKTPEVNSSQGVDPNEKFFRTLTGRSRSPTPLDDQDWETRYGDNEKESSKH
ncbi:hypothetical protein R3P38DRAFT_2969837 [Favolaschia claudopus]|uniref:JmjC domain-containing protein n=1 Tax=Favolaschia claudopus TaxID=2862362 RepID=A0AAW0B458_9AGAR